MLKYHTIFELQKTGGYRACLPLDCINGIYEDIIGSVVTVSAGEDVESPENYTDLKDRLEKFLLENIQYEEKQYEKQEERHYAQEKLNDL